MARGKERKNMYRIKTDCRKFLEILKEVKLKI